MTLEEEIKHCEKIAEYMENKEGYAFTDITYAEYASEHRQLAEWLKELKAYRDDYDYKTLKIKLENAEDIIRGLQEDLRDAREELRGR